MGPHQVHFSGAKFFKLSHITVVNSAFPLLEYKIKVTNDDEINKYNNCTKKIFKSSLLTIKNIGKIKYGRKILRILLVC